jgi:hypothetical protein
VVVYFGQFFIGKYLGQIMGYFFRGASYVSILTKLGLGHILGIIFVSSSGHPAPKLIGQRNFSSVNGKKLQIAFLTVSTSLFIIFNPN